MIIPSFYLKGKHYPSYWKLYDNLWNLLLTIQYSPYDREINIDAYYVLRFHISYGRKVVVIYTVSPNGLLDFEDYVYPKMSLDERDLIYDKYGIPAHIRDEINYFLDGVKILSADSSTISGSVTYTIL